MIIIIAVQITLASPFLFDLSAKLMGFQGANTTFKEYLQFSKIIGRPNDTGHSAHYGSSLFWRFVIEDIYNSEDFVKILKNSILILNFYYFFIRRNLAI